MLKICSAALSLALLAFPAFAQTVPVTITHLGAPACAMTTPAPTWIRGEYAGDQHGNFFALDPWAAWPPFAGHSEYSTLIGYQGLTSVALYRFATPQTAVAFVIGNPESYHEFTFWSKGKAVAHLNGAKIGNPNMDYYVSLSLPRPSTFDAFSLELKAPQQAFLAYADFNAACAQSQELGR